MGVANKKRNSLLLHEFLIRKMSKSLMSNDMRSAGLAYKLLKRYFKPGTELYKEWRLASSLHKTTVSSEAIAVSIINEAKSAVKKIDASRLDKEKSHLIKAINHGFADKNFYNQHVPDYKVRATVGSLLSWWNDSSAVNVGERGVFEEKLVRHLLEAKDVVTNEESQAIANAKVDDGNIVFKLALKKMNEAYAGKLSEEQLSIVKKLAVDDPTIHEDLLKIRENFVSAAEQYISANPDDKMTVAKLTETITRVHSDTLESFDDSLVERYIKYAEVTRELTSSKGGV